MDENTRAIVAATLATAVFEKREGRDLHGALPPTPTAKNAVALFREILAELEAEPAASAGGDPEGLDVPKVG